MAICQSVTRSPQERDNMEASRKFYMDRLNEELNHLIVYKKRAETCKESKDLACPIPRYDRYMLPIPKMADLEKEIPKEEPKVPRKARSVDTKRRPQTDGTGRYLKRERIVVADRRDLLASLKKVQGWIEKNQAASHSESDNEPTEEEIAEKLAAITLRDEKDLALETKMKDKPDLVPTVPPICMPDLAATIPRERKLAKVPSGKMVALKTSVVSLGMSLTDIPESDSRTKNRLAGLVMRKVCEDCEDRYVTNNKAVASEESDESDGMDMAFDGCDKFRNLDMDLGDGDEFTDFDTFMESGDRLKRPGKNFGGWNCDKLDKVTKFEGDFEYRKAENVVKEERITMSITNCDKLKSIAMKLGGYTKLKNMAVNVETKKDIGVDDKNSISGRGLEIPPLGHKIEAILRKHLPNNDSDEGFSNEMCRKTRENDQIFERFSEKTNEDVSNCRVKSIRSTHSPMKSSQGTQSMGNDGSRPSTGKKLRHRKTQCSTTTQADEDYETVEILSPQFKATDQPQSDNEVIICGYLGLKEDPRSEFNIIMESSDENQEAAARRKVKRKKRHVRFQNLHNSPEQVSIHSDRTDWTDSESKKVSEIVKHLDVKTERSCASMFDENGSRMPTFRDSSLLRRKMGGLVNTSISVSKVRSPVRKTSQQDHKPEWFNSYYGRKESGNDMPNYVQTSVGGDFENQNKMGVLPSLTTDQDANKCRIGNGLWGKRNDSSSVQIKDTTSTSLRIQMPPKSDNEPHFNSPSQFDSREECRYRNVSKTVTSVTNIVLGDEKNEITEGTHTRSTRRQEGNKLSPSINVNSASGKQKPPATLNYRKKSNKSSGALYKNSSACEISTNTDDFIDTAADSRGNRTWPTDSDPKLAEEATTNFFKRPKFSLDPLRELRKNQTKSKTALSRLPPLERELQSLKLEREPCRRKASNEEMAKTKSEINSLLSKTSDILMRNHPERQFSAKDSSLRLYREMSAELKKNSSHNLYGRSRKDRGSGLQAQKDEIPLTSLYTSQGYESDGSIERCPMNSLVSLVSARKPQPDKTIPPKLIPKRVSASMNLVGRADDFRCQKTAVW